MIYLGPLKDENKIKQLFCAHNLSFGEHSGCVAARDGEQLLGLCLYDLDNEKMTIHYLEPLDDLAFADGILRSTLHVAAERSVMNAFYSEAAPEEVFKKLLFVKNSDEKSLNIDKLFESCCGCNKD